MEDGLINMQKKLLEMLLRFQQFASENNLIFFLVGGSALGAERHKGFIPWDDDIDIAMARPDFERMEAEMRKQGNTLGDIIYSPVAEHIIPEAPIGFLYDVSRENTDFRNTAKIDIHPIDGTPKSAVLKKVQNIVSIIYYLSVYRLPTKHKGKLARCISKTILKLTPLFLLKFYAKVCKKIMTHWDVSKSESVCSLFGAAGYKREVMPRNYVFPLKEALFEKNRFLAPYDTKLYLQQLFGNFKEMPPLAERRPCHRVHLSYIGDMSNGHYDKKND